MTELVDILDEMQTEIETGDEVVELVVTRGIPGSGKSYWAKNWVAQDVRHRARVERDQLRAMMHESVFKGRHTENQVMAVELAAVQALLHTGISVVVSDTNLDVYTFGLWKTLATEQGFEFTMQDFREVDLNLCLTRNRERTGREFVPEEAILRMYNNYVK